MDTGPVTRRHVLAAAGTAATTALAGCSLFGNIRYSFKSRPDEGTDIVDLFSWRPASNAFHYDDAYVNGLADELRETGTVNSIEIPLVAERGTGEDGYIPSYTRHEGTYYRVQVSSEPVSVERWTVWMEPLEELPAGVDYTTDPAAGRSERDAEIIKRARREATSSVVADRDHAAQRAYRRGVVFFEPLDVDDSSLVPDPPFEYALIEPEGHFSPDELALRLHVEKEEVDTMRFTHERDPVATDQDAFTAHLEREHVTAQFTEVDTESAVQQILGSSTTTTGYDEEEPVSDAFETLLADLDLTNVELPAEREVASWLRHYKRDGAYYRARLRISDDSLVQIG